MTVRILEQGRQKQYEEALYELLKAGDREFVPPLSSRDSTTQAELSAAEESREGIRSYFEEMMTQRFLIAEEEERLLGFVSFKENYHCGPVTALPNIYISTLLVHPAGRGKGLTRRMYTELFKAYENVTVFTRTWSTNAAHIKILEGFGFEAVHVIKNHRGEGIDTVYFRKSK